MSLRLPARARRRGGDRYRPARLELLGGFALQFGGRAASEPHHVQRLLAFLALQHRPLHRAFVSGRLWPELTQEHAFGCLRTTLWRMRGSAELLEATSTHVALSDCVEVDARELAVSAEGVLKQGPDGARVDRLLHAGQLLPDWYDDWVVEERDRLGQLRVLALELATEELIRTGAYGDAALTAAAAARADPLRESAIRLLVRVHLAAGNAAEALREFHAFSARLRYDLGLEPSPQLLELVGPLV